MQFNCTRFDCAFDTAEYREISAKHLILLVRGCMDRFDFNTLPDLQECYSCCILESDLTHISVFESNYAHFFTICILFS